MRHLLLISIILLTANANVTAAEQLPLPKYEVNGVELEQSMSELEKTKFANQSFTTKPHYKGGAYGFIGKSFSTEDFSMGLSMRPDVSIYRIYFTQEFPVSQSDEFKAKICEKYYISIKKCRWNIR